MNTIPTLETKINRILVGSATPAQDLLELVNNRQITEHKADTLLRNRSKHSRGVRLDAKEEYDFQRQNDI